MTGEHYEDTVPDTLDLAERAALGLNYFMGMTEPDLDHEMYFHARSVAELATLQWSQSPVCDYTGADEEGVAVRLSDNADLVVTQSYSRTLG